MLTSTQTLLEDAVRRQVGLAALNVISLESAEAIAEGAERAGLPVVLQISENCVKHHGSPAPLIAASLAVARASAVPMAVHLDHVESRDLVRAGLELGVQSVMYDGSRLPYAANVEHTRQVVKACRAEGVLVEAELGEVGGKDGAHAPGVRTDPDEAAAFVADTGVAALAVAVGSSHAMQTRDARLDEALIRRLRDAVAVPLVLHGSSGVSDDGLRRAVAAGMTKINVSTYLNGAFTRGVRARLADDADLVDPRKYLAAGRAEMAAAVEHLVRVIAE